MRRLAAFVLAAGLMASAGVALAVTPPPLEILGGMPQVDLVALSPGDKRIAAIVLDKGKRYMMVREVDGPIISAKKIGKPVILITLDGEDHWLSRPETRLAMLKAAVAFVEKNNPAN